MNSSGDGSLPYGLTVGDCEHLQMDSHNKKMELQVYKELVAIRDKLKVSASSTVQWRCRCKIIILQEKLQELVVEESCIQKLAIEMEEREEEVRNREEEMTGREEEMKGRGEELERTIEEMKGQCVDMKRRVEEIESEVGMREVEIKGREEKMRKREEKRKWKEEEMTKKEENLCSREVEVVRRETAVSSREKKVREMERLACEAHKSLMQCIEREVQQRVAEVEGGQREETGRLENGLRERAGELRRLRQCYVTVKQTRDRLNKQVNTLFQREFK